ncbi:hypothetical protein CDL15_Pgr000862 [Punica granatum]|uniref:Uncharacterized protein n=1 Tax=Punica granatum TaxID=22663 RepID=A0A218XY69_PUNGR|nr:hypothetical protein CDL15_Pgr000862 [Punica granatum]
MDGRGATAGTVGCGWKRSAVWTVDTCAGVVGAGAMSSPGARVGGSQGVGSTVDPCARGGVEFDDARFRPRSSAIISAMLAAIKSIVPWSIATLPSSTVTRVASWGGS